MKKFFTGFSCLLMVFIYCGTAGQAQAQQNIISTPTAGGFPLSEATIFVDSTETELVRKAAAFFRQDIALVTGKEPALIHQHEQASGNLVIIGSLDAPLIRQLIKRKKFKPSAIEKKWEAYQVQVISSPIKGVGQALLIVGSDRRGTAYGVFELSKQMGVSPWFWWADVPVKKQEEIYINPRVVLTDAPKVKYRGIFINDEAPALSNWSREKFGGFNHRFYSKVFELMLRLKANYIWPAMWGSAFYDDDSLNIQAADAYGIVIGTSHHEPLMRAHDEWRRYGKGKWNYDSNAVVLRDFWRGGLRRAGNEKIVTIGMRGDGDEPMSRETATALLERIVADQRKIIEEVSGKPAAETPQLWALYKEVQDYYDKGMRVPDDVTLLLCDDNWGNIRRLPQPGGPKRKGGYGIYYHFDYVGGPRNYKWLNTNNLSRVWEQMHLAWRYGADRIWIVNVGDIKPMELPVSFFLDYAWDPEDWNEDNIIDYYRSWAQEQFGAAQAKEIGELLKKYSQYSARRKPELLDEKTYSLDNYFEFNRVLNEWKELEKNAEAIGKQLPPGYQDAYFQLVLHPISAMSNLHEMYFAAAMNRKYAPLKYAAANEYADQVKKLFIKDSLISLKYHSISNGKWNHMMSQTHIGYTYWQQPPVNKMPEVLYVAPGEMVPTPEQVYSDEWTSLVPEDVKGNVFYETEGYVSIDAANWTRALPSQNISWKKIPGIGRDGDGITSFPVTAMIPFTKNSPRVEYEFYCNSTGKAKVHWYFSPTLNIHNNEGLQFAVSLDEGEPVIISLNKEDHNVGVWNNWVANNTIIKTSEHQVDKPGKHVLKFWMISPAVVLQKITVDLGHLKPSYLGPPETRRRENDQ